MTINRLLMKKKIIDRFPDHHQIKMMINKNMIIGLYKKEQDKLQPIQFTFNIIFKNKKESDKINIKNMVKNYNIKSKLLEHMLQNISCLILENITDIFFLQCSVKKPHAIKRADYASLSVTFCHKGLYE